MASSFTKPETVRTLLWLDFYGLCKESGLNAFQVQQFMDGGSDAVAQNLSAIDVAAGSDDAKNLESAETAGEVMMAVGGAIAGIASESVIGIVVGAVIAAIGAIIKFFARFFVVECDKYHCGGYDRNTDLQRRTYRSHQRDLVGVNIPDSWELHAQSNCSCDHNYNHCSFIRFMHDGLISEGIEYATLEQGSKTKVGRVRGANAIGSGANKGCVEYWRNKAEVMPLDASGQPIAKGNNTDPGKAHINGIGTYYRRAWVVRQVLLWMETNILCRTMNCMEQVMLNTTATDDDSKLNQQRRRGSRWYASIVHMMMDVWQYSQKIGWDKVKQILVKVGASADAMAAFDKMRSGRGFPAEETPFECWPLTKHLSFNQLRSMLIELKPLFPYESTASQHLPEGRSARERSIAMKPLMLPIRTSIMYGRDMKPVPAKIGSRGPGAGTVVLGVGAAAVASYAIYRLVSRR